MIDVNALVSDWGLETDNGRTMLFVSRDSGYELRTSSYENDDCFVILADRETRETMAEVEVSNGDEEGAAVLMLMGATSHSEIFDSVIGAVDEVPQDEERIFEPNKTG